VAAAKKAPIIYLSKNGDPDKDTAAYLKSIKDSVKKAYVIGGSGVISDNIMKKASALLGLKTHETVERIWGQNRYETCIAINERFSSLLTGRSIYVSTGKNYPDALAGGVLAAHNRSAMLLCDVRLSNSQTNMLKKMHGYTLTAFGGFGAVSDELFQRVCLATAEPPRTNLY
jgi:putative cell wall-binding protein